MIRFFCCFLLIMTCVTTNSNAQFRKGMRMSGVTLGTAFFNSGKTDYSVPVPTTGYTINTNSLGITLAPSYGWFISDKVVVGAQLAGGYKYDKTLKSDENDVTYYKNVVNSFSFSAGAFARNYFPGSGSFYPFAQVGFTVGFGSSNHEGFSYSSAPVYKDVFDGKSSGDFLATAGLSIGATRMLNEHVGLDFALGYNYSINNYKYKTDTQRDINVDGTIDERPSSDLTTKSKNNGLTVGVGFQLFFGKSREK